MNQDQLNSAIRTILKIVGSALATHGLANAASLFNTEDFIGLVLLIAGIIWSHYHHGTDDPQPPQSKTSVYTWLLIGALALGFTPVITGCHTTPQRVTYQAAATAGITVETAVRAYNVFAAQGKTTIEQNRQVKAAYEKYQAAYIVVCDAGAIYAGSNGANFAELQRALDAATASQGDIINLIKSFGVKL